MKTRQGERIVADERETLAVYEKMQEELTMRIIGQTEEAMALMHADPTTARRFVPQIITHAVRSAYQLGMDRAMDMFIRRALACGNLAIHETTDQKNEAN